MYYRLGVDSHISVLHQRGARARGVNVLSALFRHTSESRAPPYRNIRRAAPPVAAWIYDILSCAGHGMHGYGQNAGDETLPKMGRLQPIVDADEGIVVGTMTRKGRRTIPVQRRG